MLIRDAELWGGRAAPRDRGDVRLAGDRIAAIGSLAAMPGETVVDAAGGLLMPGLHDHHLHLFALAAADASIRCGPPDVMDGAALARALRAAPGHGWLRGIGYHDAVAGAIDRHWLDAHGPERPVRIQHRGGRLWILNSAALDLVLAGDAPPEGLERIDGIATGRCYECDAWLRGRMASGWPDLARVGTILARFGVTGLTEMTPSNDAAAMRHLAAEQARGALPQRVFVAGRDTLPAGGDGGPIVIATKLHLHEAWLPPFEDAVAGIAASHARGRPIAIHCVTRVELVFALAAIRVAGPLAGDRIEHASIAPDELLDDMVALGVQVVTQPNFVFERGDAYLREVAADDRGWLYRLAGLRRAGIAVAGGTDAPFGDPDPWIAIRAAVDRRTRAEAVVGPEEALTPEAAVALFHGSGKDPTVLRRIEPGAIADVCLLRSPWSAARDILDAGLVRATWCAGTSVFDGVDQPPGQGDARRDAPA